MNTQSAKRRIRHAARDAGRSVSPGHPPVFILTDPRRLPPERVLDLDLPSGWAVIYRHFGQNSRQTVANALSRFCRTQHLRFLVSNDPKLAANAGADGVHWPERQVSSARAWAGRFRLMTMSWHAARPPITVPRGIDIALISTVFASNSPSAHHPLGPIRARQIARSARIDIAALGGVNEHTAGQIAGAAALAGVDMVHAFKKSGRSGHAAD